MCKSTDIKPKWVVDGFQLLGCETCGTVQMDRILSDEELDDHYNDTYYEAHKLDDTTGRYVDYIGQRDYIQNNLKRRVDWIVSQLNSPDQATWLDIGCAAGFLLDETRKSGFSPYGLDYAAFGPRFAREQLNMPNVRQGTLENIPNDFPEQFDVVSFIDVLEHVTEPRDVLRRATELVKPNGYLIGETFLPRSIVAQVTGKYWHAVDPPNHLTLMSEQGVRDYLTEMNLELVTTVNMSRWLSMPTVGSKLPYIGGTVSNMIYKTPLKKLGIPIWLNDVMLWIYQKKA